MSDSSQVKQINKELQQQKNDHDQISTDINLKLPGPRPTSKFKPSYALQPESQSHSPATNTSLISDTELEPNLEKNEDLGQSVETDSYHSEHRPRPSSSKMNDKHSIFPSSGGTSERKSLPREHRRASEKHIQVLKEHSSFCNASDGNFETTLDPDAEDYQSIRKRKKKKRLRRKNVSSSPGSSGRSRPRTSLSDNISSHTDGQHKTDVAVLLDGLPVKHVTKDEWDQIGIEASTSQPTVDELTECVVRDRKYKEVISSVSALTDHKKLIGRKTPIEFAITVQSWFHAVYSICQGLLGGLALAHFVLAFSAAGPFEDVARFASVYSSFAMPYQVMFYFLTLLCMMSILDKCGSSNLHDICTLLGLKSSVLVILLVYGATLLLSCHTSYWDLRMSKTTYNSTLLEDSLDFQSQVTTWKTLSLLRCLGGALGYFLTSMFPSTDLIRARLDSMHGFQSN